MEDGEDEPDEEDEGGKVEWGVITGEGGRELDGEVGEGLVTSN